MGGREEERERKGEREKERQKERERKGGRERGREEEREKDKAQVRELQLFQTTKNEDSIPNITKPLPQFRQNLSQKYRLFQFVSEGRTGERDS